MKSTGEEILATCAGNICVYNSSDLIRPSYQQAPRMTGWNVPQDQLYQIPELWLTYPEPDIMLHYLLAVIYFFFMFFSLTGNGVVIYIFCTSANLRSSSNMFVVNLAIADFLMMAKCPIFLYNSLHGGYELGMLGCQIFATAGSYSGIVQAMTNLCIAYDRNRTISDPMAGPIPKVKAMLMVLFTWAYATPWTIMPLLEVWGRFVPEGYLTSCTFDYLTKTIENRLFVAFIFIFSYVMPMSCIILFYSQIVGHVVNHEKALKAQAKKMNVESLRSGDQAKESAEVRICKVAIMICGLFVASWTPYAVVALIGAFGNQAMLSQTITMVPALTCKLVACIDPYVYAISHPKFRMELEKRMPWLKIKEPAPPSEAASTGTTAESTATTSA